MALLGAAKSTKVMINVCCLLFNKDCCYFSGGGGTNFDTKSITYMPISSELNGEIAKNSNERIKGE